MPELNAQPEKCMYCDCRLPKGHTDFHWRPNYAYYDKFSRTRYKPANAIWSKLDELTENIMRVTFKVRYANHVMDKARRDIYSQLERTNASS